MAEIPIERKKKRSVWPWLLGLLVVILLVWLLADNNVKVEEGTAYDERQELYYGEERPSEDLRAQEGDGRTEEFVQYVEERNGEISRSHEYTRQGLLYLADALDELYTRSGSSSEINTDELRQKARQLEQDAGSQQHANIIRDAFITAANALQTLQNNFSDQQSDDLVEKAREIQGNELATEQGEKIDEFFEMAANTVDQMANEVARGDFRERDGSLRFGPGM